MHFFRLSHPSLTLFLLLPLCVVAQPKAKKPKPDKEKETVVQALDRRIDEFGSLAQQIWTLAEVGYQEYESSRLLQEKLKGEGFEVVAGVAGIPTAFTASWGQGGPVVAILGEYDALPGVSQGAVPHRQERDEVSAGHACGHHLFGSASAAAAIAIRDWLRSTGTAGTVRFYGTPAEEGGGGKVYMARAGLFDDVDVVLHWHPSDRNGASARSSLANKSAKFRFYGVASHAAGAPERGRSALDGVEAMNYMVNMMREHVSPEARIHYVITRGGEAPNVVPAFAEVFYYCRHPEMAEVKATFERLVKAAEGAALGTGTRMEYEVIHGIYNLLPNETLSEIMHRNLSQVGGILYTEEERAFANQIRSTFDRGNTTLESAAEIQPYEVHHRGQGGSTDVGDISWLVPTAGMGAATWVPGTSAHSWQAVAAGGTSIGTKGLMVAAKTLALTAMEIYRDPAIAQKAKEELRKKRGDNFVYESLVGDREPPLDYRK